MQGVFNLESPCCLNALEKTQIFQAHYRCSKVLSPPFNTRKTQVARETARLAQDVSTREFDED